MDSIRQYLLSVILAAIVVGVLLSFVNKNTILCATIRIISSLFLVIAIAAPLINLNLNNIVYYFEDVQSSANDNVMNGESAAQDNLRSIIKTQTEAYILDKASTVGVQIDVNVILNDDTPPVPISVRISGNVSPYNQTKIKQIIEKEIGIPEEDQIWI